MNTKTNPLKAYLQLLRLPNLFTAWADILMGYLFVRGVVGQGQAAEVPKALLFDHGLLFWLIVASSMLYLAGMVLNDVFDQEADKKQRPHRPIPSGSIHPIFARNLGMGMLFIGTMTCIILGSIITDWRTAAVGVALAVMVYLYDRVLKQTPLGPIAMGACRFLNVLLGMSAIEGDWHPVHFVVAGGIGVYIVGVTWFARTEAKESNRGQLLGASAIILAGILMLASLISFENAPNLFQVSEYRWKILWGVLAVLILWRCLVATVFPQPNMVQTAVKQCIFSLIILDAVAAFPAVGLYQAGAICILLLPTMLLGRWIYST